MKEDYNIEDLFESLQGAFDREAPPAGHRERFRQRLASQGGGVAASGRSWWKPLSIAASIILLLGTGLVLLRPSGTLQEQVAEISPEASQTSFYFANLIEQQVNELKELSGPDTEPLIEDTLRRLELLEADYRRLEQDLVAGGNSKLILSAMITNFQTRIDLLQDVMRQIETVKDFKDESHDTYTI